MNTTPSTIRQYTIPTQTKLGMLIGVASLILMITILFLSTGEILIIFPFLLVSIYMVYSFLRMLGVIRLEPTGLTVSKPFRENIHLRWMEIGSISSNWVDTTFRLRDQMGERTIRLSMELDGFEDLIDEIHANRPDLFRVPPGTSYSIGLFRIVQQIFWAGIIGFVLWATIQSDIGTFIGFLLLNIIMVLWAMREFGWGSLKVTFEQEELHISTFLGKVIIDRTNIRNLYLSTGIWRMRFLVIKLNYYFHDSDKNRTITLNGFSCGTPFLYGALLAWIKAGKPS